MLNYDEPNANSPSDMPLSRWLDIWAEEFLCSVKPRTVQKYKCIIEVHLKPGLGDYSLGGLDTLTIQRFYNDQLYGRNGWRAIAPKTLKDLHGVLHSALQQAVDIGYIPRNPTKACKIARVVKPEISVLDSEQISDFLNVIKGNRFEILYIVTLFTGILDACHEETERKAAEELAAYEAKVRSGLPFVGMPEKYVSSTLLGEFSRCERNGTAYPGGRKTIGNIYYYKRDAKVYFCVFCTGGQVAEVYDNRDGNAHYPGRLINGSTSTHQSATTDSNDDSDPYHASDYPDEEEFYEEHWDDFFDFEDADTYWQEHH